MNSSRIAKILFSTAIIFLCSSLFQKNALALEVVCQDSGCTKSSNEPLFDAENISPKWGEEKSFLAINKFSETRKFAILVTSPALFDILPNPLEKVINITIKEKESGSILWGPKSLSDFKNAGELQLSDVPSGESRNYIFNAELADVDNNYQGKKVTFDLVVGFETLQSSGSKNSPTFHSHRNTGGAGTAAAVAGITAYLPFEETAGVSAPATSQPGIVLPAGEVKGASTCTDPKLWWILFVIQFLISFIFYKRANKQNMDKKKLHFFIQILNDIVFIFIFWKYFCPWWDVLVSVLIGVFWVILLKRKIDKLHEYQHQPNIQ